MRLVGNNVACIKTQIRTETTLMFKLHKYLNFAILRPVILPLWFKSKPPSKSREPVLLKSSGLACRALYNYGIMRAYV